MAWGNRLTKFLRAPRARGLHHKAGHEAGEPPQTLRIGLHALGHVAENIERARWKSFSHPTEQSLKRLR